MNIRDRLLSITDKIKAIIAKVMPILQKIPWARIYAALKNSNIVNKKKE